MTIIRPDSMPRFWWLVPWSYARQLHRNANALRALADRLDDAMTLQSHIIADQSEEIAKLRTEVERLAGNVNYWRIEAETDNARWLRVLEENDKLRKQIADIDEAIILGRAITPDPKPIE
jgi:predicted  nucleic acid-binding Zn-ribbon protein